MHLALIEDLLTEPMPAGSNLLVEYDAASQWYRASLNIAREWLRTGGEIGYNVAAQSPDSFRSQLVKLGLNVKELEASGKLEIWDWYTVTLGQQSKEKFVGADSLKAGHLSIEMAKEMKDFLSGADSGMGGDPQFLRIWDNSSVLARFNEDKVWVELLLTRIFPSASHTKSTLIVGVIRGIHSDWVYKQLEDAADGVIDLKIQEIGEETRDALRIRSMRNMSFDRRWHHLKIGENLEVSLEK